MPLKILSFPFAGGNKYAFNFLNEKLPKDKITFECLEYPGRGRRMNEVLHTDIKQVVRDAYNNIKSKVNNDSYILYGHSMGGLIAYLVCKKMKENGWKQPLKLIVSGSLAPSRRAPENIHHLSGMEFWNKINEYGGLPEELLKEENLRNFYEPILKADFHAIENYNYTGQARLEIPIDVFYGSDEKINEEQVLDWKNETSASVSIKELKGDHFFIFDHLDFFVQYFLQLSANSYV